MAKLNNPIIRKDETISHVTVLEPSSGALRGIKLTQLLQMDVTTISVLLPRITQPALLPDEVAALKPADLMKLANEVIVFFIDPDELAAAEDQARLN
ncbi:MAG: phage tail assembly protein [Rhodobacteraceae bacterium]|nr:phage tail assembly protein [Paracoccaceae bacterium]